ncbi:polysaccharide pyruvyl transferase family protein [Mycetocola zhadangensis]|uniref:polysaccharide pyruvyl transferase family protein n=1 Tax=Mycetocola zhadangensis TaxID=1164595 RepID=UPI0016040926|nr:polysaccharide pyruvyl transferase family protein [Mycetocola zhadangensis]GGE98651.1 GumL protein [Mycetocola zhadangensis]
MTVEVVHWNPPRPVFSGRMGRLIPVKRPIGNFGDLLGPMIVERMRERLGLAVAVGLPDRRLLSVGSILHYARNFDVVWGSGINGKVEPQWGCIDTLDIRAVRGPRTRARLIENGFAVPEVYGDPALLVPELFPELADWAAEPKRYPLTIIPNLHDLAELRGRPNVISPRAPVWRVLERIARSELVVGSSLHGIIVAEALGVPARLVAPAREDLMKYRDYFEATGRDVLPLALTVDAAITAGGAMGLIWNPAPLRDAFPADLWPSAL